MVDMSTPVLTRILKEAVASHQPPLVSGRRIKLKYAHQGGRNPPTVVIHGVQTDALPNAYKRYLMNFYRDQLELKGTPVRIVLKSAENPFKDKKNKLTDRQVKKRQRLVKHYKKK
jgi:GTP-binding protein